MEVVLSVSMLVVQSPWWWVRPLCLTRMTLRWALQEDRLYFNKKVFIFNTTSQQVLALSLRRIVIRPQVEPVAEIV